MLLQYPLRSSWWVRVVSSACAKFFAPSMPPADYEAGVYFRYSRQAHWSAQHHLLRWALDLHSRAVVIVDTWASHLRSRFTLGLDVVALKASHVSHQRPHYVLVRCSDIAAYLDPTTLTAPLANT